MFTIKQWIVSVSVLLSGLKAQPQGEKSGYEENFPTPDLFVTSRNYIRGILNSMAARGDIFLQDNNNTGKQVLVIAVLSASEFAVQKKDISDDMIEILPNKKIYGLPKYYYSDAKKVHGEIQALFHDNTIDRLIRKLDERRNSEDTGLPYVFIFSHYIPCACLGNVHYSCAEELANLGRVKRNTYKIIVGYRDAWNETNLEFAEKLLQEGEMFTIMNVSSGQVLKKRLKIEPEMYQEKLTKCLTSLTEIPEDTIACLINTITMNCTSGENLYGYMTQLTKAQMHECMEKYVKGLPLEIYLRFCSIETLSRTLRLMLGRPTRMCEADWTSTPDDLNWKELYRKFPVGMPSFSSGFSETTTHLQNVIRSTEYIEQKQRDERCSQNKYMKSKLKTLTDDIKHKIKQKQKEAQRSKQLERERLTGSTLPEKGSASQEKTREQPS